MKLGVRRAVLLLTVMAAMLVMASGVALAATKFGGPGADILIGTNGPDQLFGGAGNDEIDGLSGPDQILGGPGDDLLFDGENRGGAPDILVGGRGNDILFPGQFTPSQDVAICGTGTDTAFADPTDLVIGCERVLFRPPTPADFP
jgi:Ca2+-binding RTX toxin-like protein